MDETIISEFDTSYYARAICGGVIFSALFVYMLYLGLFGNLQNPGYAYLYAALFAGCLWLYFYFFSKAWKRITVTPEAIMVYDVVFKKQLIIPYTAITHIGTYRIPYRARDGSVFTQNFVIEFNGNKSVAFNEGYYNNYSRLTMAIYTYKYGIGR